MKNELAQEVNLNSIISNPMSTGIGLFFSENIRLWRRPINGLGQTLYMVFRHINYVESKPLGCLVTYPGQS
jgi:hypothetical protein